MCLIEHEESWQTDFICVNKSYFFFKVFDFELDASDMEALNKLDQGPKARGFDFKNHG